MLEWGMSTQSTPGPTPFDLAQTDALLTTTRAVRKRLDLERPVDRSVILDCIDIAQQAPTGGNRQSWHWVVVTDEQLRKSVAEVYDDGSRDYLAQPAPTGAPDQDQTLRVRESSRYLPEVLHRVPVHVIPCAKGDPQGLPLAGQASWFGSIIPAVWSFQLALRARGLGSVYTTLHLTQAERTAQLLGIPDGYTQVALLPVAWTVGTDFRPASRPPVEQIVSFDTW